MAEMQLRIPVSHIVHPENIVVGKPSFEIPQGFRSDLPQGGVLLRCLSISSFISLIVRELGVFELWHRLKLDRIGMLEGPMPHCKSPRNVFALTRVMEHVLLRSIVIMV